MYILIMFFSDGAKKSDLQDFLTELMILKEINKISHPNVIKFLGGCSMNGTIFRKLCLRDWLGLISEINISSSFTVENPRTRLVKIDHVCFSYLATTSLLSVLLSITHKKRPLYKISMSEHQNKCIYKWKKLASCRKYR